METALSIIGVSAMAGALNMGDVSQYDLTVLSTVITVTAIFECYVESSLCV